MTRWIRDWWRGYSDADLESVLAKVEQNKKPGGSVHVTHRELRAHQAWVRAQNLVIYLPLGENAQG